MLRSQFRINEQFSCLTNQQTAKGIYSDQQCGRIGLVSTSKYVHAYEFTASDCQFVRWLAWCTLNVR